MCMIHQNTFCEAAFTLHDAFVILLFPKRHKSIEKQRIVRFSSIQITSSAVAVNLNSNPVDKRRKQMLNQYAVHITFSRCASRLHIGGGGCSRSDSWKNASHIKEGFRYPEPNPSHAAIIIIKTNYHLLRGQRSKRRDASSVDAFQNCFSNSKVSLLLFSTFNKMLHLDF